MNFKKLAIALAVVFMSSLSPLAPVANLAPIAPAMAQAEAPAPAPSAAAAPPAPAQYSLGHIWAEGSWISKAILVVLAVMSAGTWYSSSPSSSSSSAFLGQASQVEKKFWTSATLTERRGQAAQGLGLPRHRRSRPQGLPPAAPPWSA